MQESSHLDLFIYPHHSTGSAVFFFFSKLKIFFSYFSIKIYCRYSSEVPHLDASNEYPQHTFAWRNKKIKDTPLILDEQKKSYFDKGGVEEEGKNTLLIWSAVENKKVLYLP